MNIDEIALKTVKAIAEIDPDKLPGGEYQAIALAQVMVENAIREYVYSGTIIEGYMCFDSNTNQLKINRDTTQFEFYECQYSAERIKRCYKNTDYKFVRMRLIK